MANNIERWQREAEENGIQFVEYQIGENNRYLLPCGHEQLMTTNDVDSGNIVCHICNNNFN